MAPNPASILARFLACRNTEARHNAMVKRRKTNESVSARTLCRFTAPVTRPPDSAPGGTGCGGVVGCLEQLVTEGQDDDGGNVAGNTEDRRHPDAG